MERDTNRTFRQIHGSTEALTSQIKTIERYLVDKKRQQTKFNLRFLTPFEPTTAPKDANNKIVNLRLTRLKEFDTTASYVSVSYAWNQSKKLEQDPFNNMPKYRIWISDRVWRRPRCPTTVLHRAMNFSYYRLDHPLVWIDQECIVQDDPADVEWHLQRMHMVYSMSKYTIALLTRVINTESLLRDLIHLNQTQYTKGYFEAGNRYTRLAELYALLTWIARDVWFERTWTFQERCSARNLFYVLPISATLTPSHTTRSQSEPDDASTIATVHDGPSSRTSKQNLSIAASQFQDLADAFGSNFGKWVFSIASPRGHVHGDATDFQRLITRHFTASKSAHLQSTAGSPFIQDVFRIMQQCDNSIVVDRLAILSNVCGFQTGLRARGVDKRNISFSTCVLVLLRHNAKWNLGKMEAVQIEKFARAVMDLSIKDVMRTLLV